MSSQQKRGFRLPWAADHASEEAAAGAATMDPPASEPTTEEAPEEAAQELGEGPFGLAGTSPTSTTDAAPGASDVPESTAEATMIDVETTTGSPASEAGSPAGGDSDWPDVDRRTSPQHADDADLAASRPPIHAVGESRVPRRENPLVAGLVKAMREAAVASREETMTRLQAEAEARVTGIRGRATSEAAELKHRAETDIAEIRDWSKAEIARIREETESRIEARKTDLTGETERHAASVERLVSEVEGLVATFESDMKEFFERLLAEDDPARLAALAEQAPDAPDLTGDGPSALDLIDQVPLSTATPSFPPAPAATSELTAETAPDPATASTEAPSEPAADALGADAAAAAEVAASEGLDMSAAAAWPAVTPASASDPDGQVKGEGATQLMVTGLTSVAGISAFKGALGQLRGVRSVSVSSGDPGVFVFAINHEPQIDLATGIAGLAGFAARITDATDAGITVVAHEPAA